MKPKTVFSIVAVLLFVHLAALAESTDAERIASVRAAEAEAAQRLADAKDAEVRVKAAEAKLEADKAEFDKRSADAKEAAAKADMHAEAAEVEKANNEFLGFRWGMGVAVSADIESGHRVESASVVNGIVRVDEENDIIPRIFLETHKFFAGPTRPALSKTGKPLKDANNQEVFVATWGQGPFVGIQSSGENVIDAFAFGYMVGWRRKLDNDNDSFNIGLGLVIDPKAQVLGDGQEANQPLPTGETEVRLKKESRIGVTLVYSFTF